MATQDFLASTLLNETGAGMVSVTTPATENVELRLAFLAFYDDLERFLASRISSDELIQPSDIVQETYFRAFRSVATFSGNDDDDFRSWLLTIAKNALTDVRRKRQRERRKSDGVGDGYFSFDSETPSRSAAMEERREKLADAVAALPAEERVAIECLYFRGDTYEEIASRLGRTKSAVHGLLCRARTRLTRELGTASHYYSDGG